MEMVTDKQYHFSTTLQGNRCQSTVNLKVTIKMGSQYDAEWCIASRHVVSVEINRIFTQNALTCTNARSVQRHDAEIEKFSILSQ